MKKIPLTKGKFALVDDEDYEHLMQWKWHVNAYGYAVRNEKSWYEGVKRKRKILFMHRLINKTPDGFHTDHIDGNTLNNKKNNLRDATRSKNMMNQKKREKCFSRYKGVCFSKDRQKWQVDIQKNKKSIFIGRFTCEIEAARAYNKAALEHFGEFARLNEL